MRLAVGIRDAAEMTGLGRRSIRRYVHTGIIKSTRCGTRVIIPISELRRLVREGAPSRDNSK